MKAPTTKCPNCGSDLQLVNQLGEYPDTNEASKGSISLHLICSDSLEDGCDYDCYDLFDFRLRVDEDNPTGDQA